MSKSAEALYGLHIDAFLEGMSEKAPDHEEFGLTEEEAIRARKPVYLARILEMQKKVAS